MKNICRSKHAPFLNTLAVIEGKWKLHIMYELACGSILRYGEIKKNLPSITHKMLSAQLKELEKDGMLIRKEYPQVPPKVEYSLTSKGLSFLPILDQMCHWGKVNATLIEVDAKI